MPNDYNRKNHTKFSLNVHNSKSGLINCHSSHHLKGNGFSGKIVYKKRNNFCNKCDDWLRNIGYYNESDEAFWKYKIYIKEAVKITPTLITEFSLLNGNKLKKAPQSFCYTLN